MKPFTNINSFLQFKLFDSTVEILLVIIIILLVLSILYFIYIWNQLKLKYNKIAYDAEIEKMALVNHFEHLIKYANDIILLANEDIRIVDANDKALETYGYTKLELLNLPLESIIADEDLPAYKEKMAEIKLKGSYIREALHKKKDGTVFPVETSTQSFKVEDKWFFQAIIRDITERKLAQQQLIESEQRYKSLFNDNHSIMLIINPNDDRIVDANNAALQFYGYTREEILKLNITDINTLPPDKIHENIGKAFNNQQHFFQFKHKLADGEIKDVEVYSGKVMLNNNEMLYSIIHDITNLKKMELELTRNQRRLIRAEHVAGFGNWEFNLKSNKIYASHGAKAIFGLNKDKDWYNVNEIRIIALPEYRELLDNSIRNLIAKDIPYDIEYKILRPTDDQIVDIHSIAEFDIDRKAIFGVIQDTTVLKKAENDLKKAKQKAEESDKLKSAFLANMSHEIRTPMNGIVGFSEMLTKNNISDEKRRHYADLISQSTQQLLSIVDDILDLSKIETGQIILYKQNVNIKVLLKEIYTYFKPKAHEKEIKLIYEDSSENLVLYTDKARLMQIFNNLIINAIKFTQKGKIKFGYNIKNKLVEFYIEDTGIGIAPENHHRIFERFQQADIDISRNFGGAGLGLAITKNLVELLGGKIWVKSEVGKGSTFHFSIPNKSIVTPDLDKKNKKEDKKSELANPITILYAEDEIINYLYVEEVFLNYQLKLIHAKNGAEAVELFKSHPEIDLVLIDIKMPIMNGFEAAEIIKELNPNITIIALTAYAMTEDRELALKSGCADYLSKPVKSDELLAMIEKYTSFVNTKNKEKK